MANPFEAPRQGAPGASRRREDRIRTVAGVITLALCQGAMAAFAWQAASANVQAAGPILGALLWGVLYGRYDRDVEPWRVAAVATAGAAVLAVVISPVDPLGVLCIVAFYAATTLGGAALGVALAQQL